MNSFTQYYKNASVENVLDEGILSGLFNLMKGKWFDIYRRLNPKVKKINNLNMINPSDIDEVSEVLFSYMHKLLSSDYITWTRKSKDTGWTNKFLMKMKNIYIVDLFSGILNKKLTDEFGKIFNLSDKYLINSWSIYKTSNKGTIQVISISDPYVGELDVHQVSAKRVGKLEGKLKNMKYFLVVDKRGEQWFIKKSGMLYKQFLVSRSDVSKDEVDADIKRMTTTYEEPSKENTPAPAEKKVGGTKKVISLPDGRKIKLEYQFKIDGDKFNTFGYSAQPSNFKTKLKDDLDNVKPFDSDKVKGKIYTLTNGGQITLLQDKKNDKYFIVADKGGENTMVKRNM